MKFSKNIYAIVGVVILMAGISLIYVTNIDGWLLPDDEGTDFYEVWMLGEGFQPGQDFIAEQQPLFLLLGKSIVKLSQSTPFLLRLAATSQVLLGTFVLASGVRYVWGGQTAVYTFILVLGSGLVYEQARMFRPDPMMFAWELGGLTASLLAVKTGMRRWWGIAGGTYGFSILWKLFGLFPVIGLFFYFFWRFWCSRSEWRSILVDGVVFAIPFVTIAGGMSLILYNQIGFYYGEAFGYHLSLGHQQGLFTQLLIIGQGILYFIIINPVFIFIIPLWFLNKDKLGQMRPEMILLLAQLLSPVIFLFFRRQMHVRYFLHLIPVLSIILAWHLVLGLNHNQNNWVIRYRVSGITAVCLLLFASLTSRPQVPKLWLRTENDTRELAQLVAAHTLPDDLVLSDYAGINFFAARRSIYEASIIAGAQIEGDVITAELLIERMQNEPVKMVLLHINGGDPPAHQLVKLTNYELFRTFLEDNFDRLTLFDRAGQEIEVYLRG